jgi:hypothetical protein
MTQGKPRSCSTLDLSFIFFKIRETRCPKTRRSWQRRARIALAKREDLTPADQHEICSVWSKSNCHLIDSPAMSKLKGIEHRPRAEQTISARSCTRRSIERCNAPRTGLSLDSDLLHQETYTLPSEPLRFVSVQLQGYICQRSRRDSDEPFSANDSRVRQRRRRGRARLKPKIKLLLKNIYSFIDSQTMKLSERSIL